MNYHVKGKIMNNWLKISFFSMLLVVLGAYGCTENETELTVEVEPTGEEGPFLSPVSVTLTPSIDSATIYYTTDGTQPSEDSDIYEDAITIEESTTLTFYALAKVKSDSMMGMGDDGKMQESEVYKESYDMGTSATAAQGTLPFGQSAVNTSVNANSNDNSNTNTNSNSNSTDSDIEEVTDSTSPTITLSGISTWQTSTATAAAVCTDASSGCDSGTVAYKYYESATSCSTTYSDYTDSAEISQHRFVCAAVKDVAGNVGVTSMAVEFKVDNTSPAAPSGLTLSAPSTSPGTDTTPTISVSGLEVGSVVKLYSNSTCSNIISTAITIDTATMLITTLALSEGSFTIYAKQQDPAGNSSACSTASVSYVLDQSVVAPTGLTLASPASSPAVNPNPTITVSGVEDGASVTLYSDSSCLTSVSSAATASGTSVTIATNDLSMTSYSFYAKQVDAAGNTSGCSTASVAFYNTYLDFVEVQTDGSGGVDGLGSAVGVTISPDNRFLYVSGSTDDAIAVFARDLGSGQLTYVEMEKDGVNSVDGLDYNKFTAISNDGKHLYAASLNDDAVAVFSRNVITGALTFVEVEKDGVNSVDGIDGASAVAVSHDGKHVYVTSMMDGAVAVFTRDSSTGALTYASMVKDGTGGVDGLASARYIILSSDNKYAYVASYNDDAVTVFSRNASTGALTYVEHEEDGSGGVDGLNGSRGLAFSPDERYIYAAGNLDDSLVVFSRDPSNGQIAYVETHTNNQNGVEKLDGCSKVVVTPDGRFVITSNTADDALAVFARDVTTGELTFKQVITDSDTGLDGLANGQHITMSKDGLFLYVASLDENKVGVFKWVPSKEGELNFVEFKDQGVDGVDGIGAVYSIGLSPDMKNLYSVAYSLGNLAVFSRNLDTGELTYSTKFTDGSGGVDGLSNARSIVVSPDGLHVYTAAQGDHAVAVFSRNTSTGALTYVEMKQEGTTEGDSDTIDGINKAAYVLISPNGEHVYASGWEEDSIALFSRDASDGTLDWVAAYKDNAGGFDGLDNPQSMDISPNGRHIYVCGMNESKLAVLARDTSDGTLSFVEVKLDNSGGVDGIASCGGVSVSPDGDHVYASGYGEDKIAACSRNHDTGAVTFVEAYMDGVDGVSGMDMPNKLRVSPDGKFVVVTAVNDDAIVVFTRNRSTGALTYKETQYDGQQGVDGLNSIYDLRFSKGSLHLYGAGYLDSSIPVFKVK